MNKEDSVLYKAISLSVFNSKTFYNFKTPVFLAVLSITYGEYLLNRWPLWIFVSVFLLYILLTIFSPIPYLKSAIKDKELLKKVYLYHLIFIESMTLLVFTCVNVSLGYIPFYIVILLLILIFLMLGFLPILKNKDLIKIRILNFLYAFILLGLIFLLGFVCAKNYPLWLTTLVLLLNILYLIFIIRRKNDSNS